MADEKEENGGAVTAEEAAEARGGDLERETNDEYAGTEEGFGALEDAPVTRGGPEKVRGVVDFEPSSLSSPYMSPEEQTMEMVPQVVGPPAYGSPDPQSSAGRLRPLSDHPNAENISEDYGSDIEGVVLPSPEEGGSQTGSGVSPAGREDLGPNQGGSAEASAEEGGYEEMTVAELKAEAANREIQGRAGMNKDELIAALEEDDAAQPDESEQ